MLVPALLKFYIDIEFTGASHQFYAKYEYRHYCSRIFKTIFRLEEYKNSFKNTKSEIIERFINMIMNDSTYCIDEGLANMEKLIKVEDRLANGEMLSQEDEAGREQFQNIARSVFSNVKECLELMGNISTFSPKSFFYGDFKKRMAQLLNYFLVNITSTKFVQLKAKFETLNFKPGKLLKDIVLTYTNLCFDKEFCEEVTKDERSYKPEEMLKAAKRIGNERSLDDGVIGKFEEFISMTQNIQIETQDIASKLGEIPDDFLDPISADLMRDPVMLPNSKTIMDRSTIKQHLLNDEHDPFNRSPLKIGDLVEMPELKKKIEDWIQMKLKGASNDKKVKELVVEEDLDTEKSEDPEQTTRDLFYQRKF